ncbi:MAG: methyltransferase domain-containing protein [Gemmatimonadetes bacterium]|nr:methyltransferase domain-containing protein [Gemmatimonadota bacterium]
MRILESSPRRYDLGIRLLTFGHLDRAYNRLVSHVARGQRVLDLGCGTGALTLRAARRGAVVRGIDVNPQMLEIAERRARDAGLAQRVELKEMGVAQLDEEEAESYDAVMSGLCFSELSEDELAYTLKHVARVLRPGGLLLVADEVRPRGVLTRLMHSLIKMPLAGLTYLITQQTTKAVSNLPEKILGAGLSIVSTKWNHLGSFCDIVARKSERETS